uniref:Uncharacterized protein n=3 Tax=Rhodnius prolixus TaxID=13249 RepID=T1HFK3_RHOPR
MKGEVSRRDIVSSIITAANRKMLKTKSRKQVASSGDEIVQLERTGERVRDGRKSSGGSGGSGSSSMLVSGGSSEPEIVSSTTNIASTGSGGSGGDDKSVAGAIATGVRDSVIFSGSLLQSSLSQE